jgi:hypothetical protein
MGDQQAVQIPLLQQMRGALSDRAIMAAQVRVQPRKLVEAAAVHLLLVVMRLKWALLLVTAAQDWRHLCLVQALVTPVVVVVELRFWALLELLAMVAVLALLIWQHRQRAQAIKVVVAEQVAAV